MTTRVEGRISIREILRDFYDIDTVATGGINSSSTTLPVNNAGLYNVGDVLTVESEQMKVDSIDTTLATLTVTRGYNLTTSAAHVATKTIIINPEFSDRALNLAIDLAIGDTYRGGAGIWIPVVDETLLVTTAREYTIPTGLTNIARVQVEDENGYFQENRDWELIGTKIQFKQDPGETGDTIRVIGSTFQSLPADDTTVFTLSNEQLQFVWYDAAWHALQQRFAQRLKATQYSASVNDRAGQPLELISMINSLKQTVEGLKYREFMPRQAEYATRPRR